MNDKDILQRFLFENAQVRGEIVHLETSFQTIINQHNYPPILQKILGEMLVVVNLLCASIKFNGRVTVQFQGKGKLKLLLAQSTHELNMRGLAQWQGELSATELQAELKAGLLAITMDPQDSTHNRYQGMVAWHGDSLAHSIEGYFIQSEQIPTRLWLAVDEQRAAGFLIQALPHDGMKDDESADWEHISLLTDTLTAHELLNLDHKTLLRRLYVEEDVRIFAPTPVSFRCTCSTQRSENALRMLGREEVDEELNQKQQVVVTCEFCNNEFVFDRVDIERIFKPGDAGTSAQVH